MSGRGDKRKRPEQEAPNPIGRPPSQAAETEKVVLATVLFVPHAFLRVRSVLRVEHFFGEPHQLIFAAALDLARFGQPVDIETVKAQLHATDKLNVVGGVSYLGGLSEFAERGRELNILAYAKKIIDAWKKRQKQQWGAAFVAESFDAPDIDTFGAAKLKELSKIVHGNDGRMDLRHIAQSVSESVSAAQQRGEEEGAARGVIPSRFRALDNLLAGGFRDEESWIIAGRSGLGKTSLALGIAGNVGMPVPDSMPIATPRLGVAIFELEMPEIQVTDRLICMLGGIPLTRWRSGKIGPELWVPAARAADRVNQSNIWVDATPGQTIEEIEAKVQALKAEWDKPATFAGCPVCSAPLEHVPEINRWHCSSCYRDPRAADAVTFESRVQLTREQRIAQVVIDHVGLVKEDEGAHSREREVAKISGHCKAMAKKKRLNLSVVLLVQLSRAIEMRKGKDKKPQLSDLRESGSLENDADGVIFPWRPGYYKPSDKKIQNEATLIVAKQRNGPPGEVDVLYEPECSRFDDADDALPEGL